MRSRLDSGFGKLIAQLATKGHPEMDKMGVPLAIDFAKTDEDRKVMELIYSQLIFGRPYVLPPGTPPDRVAALRKAFMAALQDKDISPKPRKWISTWTRSKGETCRPKSPKLTGCQPTSSNARSRRWS